MTTNTTPDVSQSGRAVPLRDKFALQPLPHLVESIHQGSSFKRYDLSKEKTALELYMVQFRETHHRDPFTFDLLDDVFRQLDPALARRIKTILYQKDATWFTDVGQYLFYNLFQWAQAFPAAHKGYLEQEQSPFISRCEFLHRFWTYFSELDEDSTCTGKNRPSITAFPQKILLELTNNCNLNCVMCGVGKAGYDPKRTLPRRVLRQLREEVFRRVKWIRLNGLGESTIIPEFLDYLAVLTGVPGQLEIVTNLTVQNERVWQALLDARTFFLISCDSADPAHYEAIRRGAKYSWFAHNLDFLGHNLATPALAQVIFTLLPENIDDLLGVIDLAARHSLGGIIVNIAKLKSGTWSLTDIAHILHIFQAAHTRARDLGITLKLPDHVGSHLIDPKIATPSTCTTCPNPWEEVYVRYNGDLTACNMLNPYIYGNIRHGSFAKLWQGINAALFRLLVNTNFRHPYCRECYFLT